MAMGGVRQQFMSAVNIRMVQCSLKILEQFHQCQFRQRGYLFLATESTCKKLRHRYETQKSLGAECAMLDVAVVRRLVPELRSDDLVGGLFGPKDGYVEPRATLRAFRSRAEELGAVYVSDEVRKIEKECVYANKSGRIPAGRIVIAAGAYSGAVGKLAAVDVPVTPVRQQLFRCALPRPWAYEFPVVIDPGGVHWRSSPHDGNVIGKTNRDEPPGLRVGGEFDRFHQEFMLHLGERIQEFSGGRLEFGGGGLYEMTPDHNGIIDRIPDIEGSYLAAGFSGHGLMMSSATGKLMPE